MIVDSLDRLERYCALLPLSGEIGQFLETVDLASLPIGTRPIIGNDLYVSISEYPAGTEAEKKWESHRIHIDLQIILQGEEYIGHKPVKDLIAEGACDAAKDVCFFKDPSRYTAVFLPKGGFCIFFPEDGHKPGFHPCPGGIIRKAVFKIRT